MKILDGPTVEVIDYTPDPIKMIARAARTCYQSMSDGAESDLKLCQRLIVRGHTAMLEFAHLTFRIVTDRGISHELVRHRIASYAQESTRYCNYGGKDMEFIKPSSIELDSAEGKIWSNAMAAAELNYKRMLEMNCSPQVARSVLPNSLKTEIVAKFNVRSFRNFLFLRTATTAHPDMRELADQCYSAAVFYGYAPLINDCVRRG
ncbi:MAG: FAD-dependent thymidylate synthase [Methanocorpusculum sp.]|nr:FAD-dependent thymidylate synthase [Methanocorpusculum sp.]